MAKAKPVTIGNMTFDKKGDALTYLREMLNRYALEEKIDLSDANFLKEALRKHPEHEEKVGVGIDYFIVRTADYGTRCFWIVRVDQTEVKFSYKYCV